MMLWVDVVALILCLSAGVLLLRSRNAPKWKKRLAIVMFAAAFCALCYLVAALLLLGGIQ